MKKSEAYKSASEQISINAIRSFNADFKNMSLSRVLAYMNQPKVKKVFSIAENLTIEDLKTLCPELTAPKVNKKGHAVVRQFTPYPFMVALRKQILSSL